MTATSKFVANDSINILIVVYLTFNIIGRSSEQQNHENWYSNNMDENKVLLIFYLWKNPWLFSYVNKYVWFLSYWIYLQIRVPTTTNQV